MATVSVASWWQLLRSRDPETIFEDSRKPDAQLEKSDYHQFIKLLDQPSCQQVNDNMNNGLIVLNEELKIIHSNSRVCEQFMIEP